MGELFITIFVFLAVSGIAGVLFVVWVIVNVAQLVRRTIAGNPRQMPFNPSDLNRNVCVVPNCRAINPPAARFCRRCGHSVGEPIALARQSRPSQLRRRQLQMFQGM